MYRSASLYWSASVYSANVAQIAFLFFYNINLSSALSLHTLYVTKWCFIYWHWKSPALYENVWLPSTLFWFTSLLVWMSRIRVMKAEIFFIWRMMSGTMRKITRLHKTSYHWSVFSLSSLSVLWEIPWNTSLSQVHSIVFILLSFLQSS